VRLELLNDVDVVVLAVSEDPHGGGRFLLFQRAKSFTEQDRALGMDTFSLTDPSGATAYGAVLAYRVNDEELALDFAPGAAQSLALPTEVRVKLNLSASALTELQTGLSVVIDGRSMS
jgi:hypothetical protein